MTREKLPFSNYTTASSLLTTSHTPMTKWRLEHLFNDCVIWQWQPHFQNHTAKRMTKFQLHCATSTFPFWNKVSLYPKTNEIPDESPQNYVACQANFNPIHWTTYHTGTWLITTQDGSRVWITTLWDWDYSLVEAKPLCIGTTTGTVHTVN
jgi:hypothetical protein